MQINTVVYLQNKPIFKGIRPMTHEITQTDSLFVSRTPAWHGFGKVLQAPPMCVCKNGYPYLIRVTMLLI